jgi:copper chaperone CopZ
MMDNQSCANCRCLCNTKLKDKCKANNYDYFLPNYQTLEAQLKAEETVHNLLEVFNQVQIDELESELQQMKEAKNKIETQLFNLYGKLFKNYAWTDCETAIDLMGAEILVSKEEKNRLNEAIEKAAQDLKQKDEIIDKLTDTLNKNIQGYKNLIEFGIIPERYYSATQIYIDEYYAVLEECRRKGQDNRHD